MKHTLLFSALLLLWAILLISGLGAYILSHNSDKVARDISSRLTAGLTGTTVNVEEVSLQFFPRPALKLGNVVVRNADGLSLWAASCSLAPRWLSLLTGTVRLGWLGLDQPILVYPMGSSAKVEGSTAINLSDNVYAFLSGLHISIHNGRVQIVRGNGPLRQEYVLSGIKGSLRLPVMNGTPQSGSGQADIQVEAFTASTAGQAENAAGTADFTLRHPDLKLEKIQLTPGENISFRTWLGISADIPVLSAGANPGRFACTADICLDEGKLALSGKLALKHSLTADKQSIPLLVQVPFAFELTSPAVPEAIRINNASFTCAEDAATFTGEVRLTGDEGTMYPTLKGSLNVARFSLPRWFRFARFVPGGLQQALDNLSGQLEGTLNANGLRISRARLMLADMPFTGTAGVDSFTTPRIQINLATDKVNAMRLFPELSGTQVKALYSGPCVFDMLYGSLFASENSSQSSILYDVRISAGSIALPPLTGQNFALRISPEGNSPAIQLNVDRLYGGKLSARLIPDDLLQLNVSLAALRLEALPAGLSLNGAVQGSLTATAALRAAAGDRSRLLSTAKGTVSLQLDNASLNISGADRPNFRKLALSVQGGGQKGNTATAVTWNGKWFGEMVGAGIHLTATADGPVRFIRGKAGLRASASGLEGSLRAWLNRLQADFSATLGFDTDNGSLTLKNIRGHSEAFDLTGEIMGSGLRGSPVWQGKIAASRANPRKILQACASLPENLPDSALSALTAEASIAINEDILEIRNVNGKLDQTTFSGQLNKKLKADRPQWNFNLDIGALNVDNYLPQTGGKKTDSPWPTNLLKAADVQGKITAQKLTVARIPHEKLQIPISLNNGILTADPITAAVAGGKAGAGFRAEAESANGPVARLRYTLNNCSLYTLSVARNQADAISGTGTLDADITGRMRSSADIPATLNGTWKFAISNGGLGKSFRFNYLGASGRIASGILSSQDMAIRGSSLNVQGHGWIDMVKKRLDYQLTLSGSGLPNIPVRYYGSLSDPKRSINASRIILGTLSSLFNGTLNVLDMLISAPLRFLGP